MHTPGPWRVPKAKARRVTTEHGVMICNAVLRNQGGPEHKAFLKDEIEAEANALLIAAAPELLEALKGVQSILDRAESNASGNPEWDHVGPRVAAARAAIAKARGEA